VLVSLYAFLTVVIEVAGIILALKAILIARTPPQSAIGWAIALVIVPVVAIPLFLVFGESRFSGYTRVGTGGSAPLDNALRATFASHGRLPGRAGRPLRRWNPGG